MDMFKSNEEGKTEEIVGELQRKRPDNRIKYERKSDGIHIAFVDGRKRRFVMVIAQDLQDWRPKSRGWTSSIGNL